MRDDEDGYFGNLAQTHLQNFAQKGAKGKKELLVLRI